MPVEYLQGTPFSDYTIPGLLLLISVGESFLFSAATILTGREVGVLASALAGLILIGFATALQKVENKFNKNTTQYFYLYTTIMSQKVENELDNNTNI